MATTSISSPFSFVLTVPNISKLKEITSDYYTIEGTQWKVRVSKETIDSMQYLGIFLQCKKKILSSIWSHAAAATFKLLTFGENADVIDVKSLGPFIFDNLSTKRGLRRFRAWDDLFDAQRGYVKDGMIRIGIKIEVDSRHVDRSVLKSEPMGEFCKCTGLAKFHLTVTNIENLIAVRSSQFVLRDMPWNLLIYKNCNSFIVVRLQLSSGSNISSYQTKVTVNLLSSKNGVTAIGRTASQICQKSVSTTQFISCNELLNPDSGFVRNGAIDLEVEIEVANPKDIVATGEKRRSSSEMSVEPKVPKFQCPVCKKTIIDQDTTCVPCGHLFCTACIVDALNGVKRCPVKSCNAKVPWNGLRRICLEIAK
ncbi:hypothetical protein HA402_009643 [Bradysia odoriphaga]|nr:hypothetical protein HA402_009643 [Bradysia odoriphaga]